MYSGKNQSQHMQAMGNHFPWYTIETVQKLKSWRKMISINEVSGLTLTFYVLNFPVKFENEEDFNPLRNMYSVLSFN